MRNPDDPDEPRPEPRPWIGRTLQGFRPYARDLAIAIALLLVGTRLTLVGPRLLQHALDVDVKARDLDGLARTAGTYVLVLAALVVTTFLQRARLNKIGQSTTATLRSRLLERIVTLPVSALDEQPSGKLMTRVMSDVDALRELMTSTFLALVGDLLLFVAMAVIMIREDVQLAAIALGLLPAIGVGFFFFQRTAGPRFAAARAKNGELTGFLAEHLRAMPVLQALDRTGWARQRCRALSGERYDLDRKAERAVITYFNSITLTEALGTATILVVGGSRVAAGTLTLGTLVLFLDFIRRYYEPVHRLSEQLSAIERARAAAHRIYAILDRAPEPDTVPIPARASSGAAPDGASAATAPRLGEVRFEDVWFTYRALTDEQARSLETGSPDPSIPWVLRGVSFTIAPGQRFALVGPTGHGKSTILSLLLRFHVAQRGRVLVDGEDVRAVPLEPLRRRFGLVLQDVRLFPGSLAENVLLSDGRETEETAAARGTPVERARAALEAVGAGDLEARLPDGLATVLGDGGEGLSFGERQLVACARALAREPRILLLDEATSSVDPATEARLQAALEKLARGRTSLTVAHRLATIRSADRILLVERGEIVEAGSRDELLARGGRYAALEKLQQLEQRKARPTRERAVDAAGVSGG